MDSHFINLSGYKFELLSKSKQLFLLGKMVIIKVATLDSWVK